MVTVAMLGDDDLDPLRIEVVGRDLQELVPFLRLADMHGVTATVLPKVTAGSQHARAVVFDLVDAASAEGLVVFLTACLLLVKPNEAEQAATRLRDQAVGDMNDSRTPF